MKKVLLVALAIIGITAAVAFPGKASAEFIPCQPSNQACLAPARPDAAASEENCTTDKCDLINLYLNPFIRFLSLAVGLVVIISLIIAGIQYSTSAGDPQKAAAARKHIQNALLGLLAYFLLYSFLRFLVPGVSIFKS